MWQEPYSRVFVGDPGSATLLHNDLIPQIELCHVLSGVKVLGVASWEHTPTLLQKYGGSALETEGQPSIYIPAHRKLSAEEKELLLSPAVSLLLGRPGDLVVFSSAAAHFATNGLREVSTAIYHGGLTPATIPRLCADPKGLSPFSSAERSGEYSQHLTGQDLVQEYSGGEGIAITQQLRHRLRKHGSAVLPSAEAGIRYQECLRAMEAALAAAKKAQPAPSWEGEAEVWLGGSPSK